MQYTHSWLLNEVHHRVRFGWLSQEQYSCLWSCCPSVTGRILKCLSTGRDNSTKNWPLLQILIETVYIWSCILQTNVPNTSSASSWTLILTTRLTSSNEDRTLYVWDQDHGSGKDGFARLRRHVTRKFLEKIFLTFVSSTICQLFSQSHLPKRCTCAAWMKRQISTSASQNMGVSTEVCWPVL